jgi:hypothetical protein
MKFSLAQPRHLEDICEITAQAKAQLKHMNLDQWQKGYPSQGIWENDIKIQQAWVALEGDLVLGVFAFQTTPIPLTGKSMENGCPTLPTPLCTEYVYPTGAKEKA